MTNKDNKKETQTENKILNTIYTIIENETLSKNKSIDLLITLKGAIQQPNNIINLDTLLKIYTLLLKKMPINQTTNNLILINFHALFKYINGKKEKQYNYIRKFLLLLEYYLMNNSDFLLKEQIELILYIIEEYINHNINQFYYQYGFLFLKLYDVILSKKFMIQLKSNLHKIKEIIIKTCPKTPEADEIKRIILSKKI